MYSDILATLRELPSPLSEAFFSDANVARIQADLITQVARRMQYKITSQKRGEVLNVMIYLYNNSDLNQYTNVAQQVTDLNDRALRILVELTITGIKQYLTNLRDSYNVPTPLQLPQSTSVAGTKLYGTPVVGARHGYGTPSPQALAW